jgi:uncharacterized protein YjbI with pentapeptide repeats
MPLVRDSELALLLREGKLDDFNRRTEEEPPNLENCDLRLVDLRGANLRHAILRGAYLRNADLRGVDLSHADLDGASMHEAKVSGVWFPRELDADEVRLSVQLGTRLRVRR